MKLKFRRLTFFVGWALAAMLAMSTAEIQAAVPSDEENVYFILSGEADEAIAKGDYVTAIERIKEALASDPGNPSNVLLMSNLGLLYSEIGSDSLALDILDHAHNIAPAMVQVLENRALVLSRVGDYDGAYDDYTRIIDLDAKHKVARFYHGMILMQNGDIDGAKIDFDVLAATYPDEYATWFTQAIYNTAIQDYVSAAKSYKKLIEADPCEDFYAGYVQCCLMTQELSEAAATLGEALSNYPDSGLLYYYRAWLNRDSFRYKDARADADRAISLGVDRATVNALFE